VCGKIVFCVLPKRKETLNIFKSCGEWVRFPSGEKKKNASDREVEQVCGFGCYVCVGLSSCACVYICECVCVVCRVLFT
jgi:hypothetical protein